MILEIIILLAGIGNLFLGLLVWKKNTRSKINIYFGLVGISTSIWALVNFLFEVFQNQLFIHLSYSFGAIVPCVGLIWMLHLFEGTSNKKINNIRIPVLIIGSFLFVTSLINNFIITGEYNEVTKNFDVVPGPFYYIYSVLAFLLILSMLIVSYSFIKRSYGVKRTQAKYILVGVWSFSLSALTVSFILPLFNYIELAKLDSPSSLLFVAFSAYAIIKHRFLDIRLVILRTITYSLVVIFISTTVVGFTLLLPEFFNISITIKTFIAVITSIFIVLIISPLKNFIGRLTDNLFFKASVDYQKLLSELSEIINREIDLDLLLYGMSRKLEKKLKIKNTSIYLAGSTGGAFYKRIGHIDPKTGKKLETNGDIIDKDAVDIEHRISHDSELIKYLKKTNDIVVLESLERKIEDAQDEKERKILEKSKEELDRLDAAVVAPVVVGNILNGVMVFGPKLSGDPYGSEDINLLQLIGPQLASALDKSRLYDEAQQFTERLKKEVAMATVHLRDTNLQLQERNRFLAALQKVTTLMTQTLDFKKVTQSIADSIASELGYLGGIVMFLGKDRHKLFPDAITQSPLTKKALKLLPKPYAEYYGDFRKDKSRSITAIKEGKVQIGNDLNEFITPAVPSLVSKAIQKAAGIKTIVAVPIFSENEVIGVIDFLLDGDASEIKETDLSIMEALANQTGIVYRNIVLYEQVQDSNKELAEANKHLQQLDKAKSEFVSIASHQLRTPMTGIMGYLSMILQGDFGKVPAEQDKVLSGLLDESNRMIRLINLFLNVSKIESGKMDLNLHPTPIEDTIKKVVALTMKAAKEKGLKLVYKKSKKKLPLVMGDHDKLGDIILNLTDNAIKYTDKGSITLETKVDGKFVQFSCHDTGRGIHRDETKKLFTKFVRGYGIAQVNPDGSGLGLYVARRLTEAHHGKIWVDSEGLGKGSSFHIKIPIAKEQAKK